MTSALFVASRGSAADSGLYYFFESGDSWRGIHLAAADQLAALCWHPTLPVIYGLSGLGRGTLFAWDVSRASDGHVTTLAVRDSLGTIPCDLAVSPDGSLLVAANFGLNEGPERGSLASWTLDEAGVPDLEGTAVALADASHVDPERQAVPHPHQIVFHDGALYVPDYGADRIRRFDVGHAIVERDAIAAPPGSAPRHLVFTDDGRIAASAELGNALILGGESGWAVVDASARTGPAAGRHERNYPGDLKRLGRNVYFANRGYDTISTFDVSGAEPVRVSELAAGCAWPQHLLVQPERLLVAGWDSSTVTALPLVDGVPQEPRVLFECAGAGWLLAAR